MESLYNALLQYFRKNGIIITNESLFNEKYENFYLKYSFLGDKLNEFLFNKNNFNEKDYFSSLSLVINNYLLNLGDTKINCLINIVNLYGKNDPLIVASNVVSILNMCFTKEELGKLINTSSLISKSLASASVSPLLEDNGLFYNLLIDTYNDTQSDYELDEDEYNNLSSMGLFLKDLRKYKSLTKEEVMGLFIKYHQGDQQAYDMIIKSNIKMIVSVAKLYVSKDFELLELIDEGFIGLTRAIESYDETLGFAFSTYAYYWIKQGITRAIANKSRNIRLPIHFYEKVKKYQSLLYDYNGKYGQAPDDGFIADEMGITVKEAKLIEEHIQDTVSLFTKVGEDDDTNLADFISTTDDFTTETENKELNKLLLKIIDETLSPKEKAIILYRFGFIDGQIYSLQSLGNYFHLTRERIRQLQNKAIKKLLIPAKELNLDTYYYDDNGDNNRLTMNSLFNYISFNNEYELNLFLNILNIDELKIIKKVYDNQLNVKPHGITKAENCKIRGIINLFNEYKPIISNKDYGNILMNILNNPAEFNIYYYLNDNNYLTIEKNIEKLKILLKSNFSYYVSLKEGNLKEVPDRYSALLIIKVLYIINKEIFSKRGIKK